MHNSIGTIDCRVGNGKNEKLKNIDDTIVLSRQIAYLEKVLKRARKPLKPRKNLSNELEIEDHASDDSTKKDETVYVITEAEDDMNLRFHQNKGKSHKILSDDESSDEGALVVNEDADSVSFETDDIDIEYMKRGRPRKSTSEDMTENYEDESLNLDDRDYGIEPNAIVKSEKTGKKSRSGKNKIGDQFVRRVKNNEASKRSRLRRKMIRLDLENTELSLAEKNKILKKKLAKVDMNILILKELLRKVSIQTWESSQT